MIDTNTIIRFKEVSVNDSSGLQKVAKLHSELLHFGPFAKLGTEFIRDVGYKLNVQNGLMNIILCEVSGKAAGYIAYVSDSIKFHRKTLIGNRWYIVLTILRAIVKSPERVLALYRIARVMISRRNEKENSKQKLGEVISIAVKPEYCSHKFIRENKVKISQKLVEDALEELANKGLNQVRMIVDEDNKAPLFLYHSMGARIDTIMHGGKKKVVAIFDIGIKQ